MLSLPGVILNHKIHYHPLQVSIDPPIDVLVHQGVFPFHLASFIEWYLACFDMHVVDWLLICMHHVFFVQSTMKSCKTSCQEIHY